MKKILLLLTTIFFNLSLEAQDILNKKVVIESRLTAIYQSSEPTQNDDDTTFVSDKNSIVIEQNKSTTGDMMVIVRQLGINPLRQGKVELLLNTKQIKQKNDFLDVDTNEPFSDNPKTAKAVEHYQKFLDKNLKIFIEEKTISEKGLKNLGPWDEDLPVLHEFKDLNGFILNLPTNNPTSWKDSITTQKYRYLNSYEQLTINGTIKTYKLSGFLSPLYSHTPASKLVGLNANQSKNAGNIEVDEKITKMSYEGVVSVNTEGLIIQLDLKALKSSSMKIYGTTRLSSSVVTYKLVNSIK